MTDQEFSQLVSYVSDNISHDLDRYAMRMIGDREPIPHELQSEIDERAEEWCDENGIDADEYYGEYDAEDVFLDDNYNYEG